MDTNIKVITWKEFTERGIHGDYFLSGEVKIINGKLHQLYDSNIVYNPGGETVKVWVEVEEFNK